MTAFDLFVFLDPAPRALQRSAQGFPALKVTCERQPRKHLPLLHGSDDTKGTKQTLYSAADTSCSIASYSSLTFRVTMHLKVSELWDAITTS